MTDNRDKKKHPIQPLAGDGEGVVRFKKNRIVDRLLEEGPFDMNDIARWDVSRDDRIQFAQLIGYSHSGFGELSYVDNETYAAAERMYELEESELEARLNHLQELVETLKEKLREPMAELFEIHPSDLKED